MSEELKILRTGLLCELNRLAYLGYCGCGCGRQLGPHDRVHDVMRPSNGATFYVRADCLVQIRQTAAAQRDVANGIITEQHAKRIR